MPTPNQHPFTVNRVKAMTPIAAAPVAYTVSTTGFETRSHKLARPEASDHERWPSREGNLLVYRDGRREVV